MTCEILYEPKPANYEYSDHHWKLGTHTCDLNAGHEGAHHCPRCGINWTRPRLEHVS